jgi:hypothetical protein
LHSGAQRIAFDDLKRLGLCIIKPVYASQPSSPATTQHSLKGGSLLPYPRRTFTGWKAPASLGALRLVWIWVAIGVAILATVGLVTYGLVLFEKQSQERSLGSIVERNKVVSRELAKLLDDVPRTSLARVSIIHNIEPTVSGASLVGIDQANTMVPPGRVVPVPQRDIPLSQWTGDLDEYTSHECVRRQTGELADTAFRERLLPLQILFYVGCPLIDSNGVLYGAVFLNWDDLANVLPPRDMDAVVQRVQAATAIIGGYYLHMR